MRYYEIIRESLGTYKPMFATMYPDGLPNPVRNYIMDVEKTVKRNDRVTWFLRWKRIEILLHAIYMKLDPNEGPEKNLLQKYTRELGVENNADDELESVLSLTDIEHYLSLPISEIQNYIFNKQKPSVLLNDFLKIEREWQESISDTTAEREDDHTKLIDFGNGWAWWNLNKESCSNEARAMGHCGNSAAGRYGENIMSLRKKITDDIWEPHLTFILDGDGYFGEMKGRANLKPHKKYHSMIVELLKNDVVQGIKGGGHAPEENFSLDDLPDNEADYLRKLKIGFNTISDLLKEGKKEEAAKLIKKLCQSRGYSFNSIVYKTEHPYVIIEKYSSVLEFCRYNYHKFNDLFQRLELNLDADVYSKFCEDYLIPIFNEHWYYFFNYQADINLNISADDGTVMETISFSSLDDILFQGEEDFTAVHIDHLNDIHEWGENIENIDSYIDDIDEMVCSILDKSDYKGTNTSWKGFSNLCSIISDRYGEDYDPRAMAKGTTRDPRQMSLDI